jgi:hypothetical protein
VPTTAASSAAPSPSATTGAAAVTPVPASSPVTAPAASKLKTFTFPDGHISFDHPANWTVRTKQGAYLTEPDKANSVEAEIFDETGKKVAYIASGSYGDGAVGPVNRTLLDSQPLPAFPHRDGGSSFGFVMDTYPDGAPTSYFMAVMQDQFITEGPNSISANSNLIVGNGAASAAVIFDSPAFPSPAAAKAWMGTEQYSQLKNMLTSLRYS